MALPADAHCLCRRPAADTETEGYSSAQSALEGYIFVRDFCRVFIGRRGSLIKAGTRSGATRSATFSVALAAATQQHQILSDNLRSVLLLAALLVFPTRSLKPAFNVNLGSLLHVFANDLRQPL